MNPMYQMGASGGFLGNDMTSVMPSTDRIVNNRVNNRVNQDDLRCFSLINKLTTANHWTDFKTNVKNIVPTIRQNFSIQPSSYLYKLTVLIIVISIIMTGLIEYKIIDKENKNTKIASYTIYSLQAIFFVLSLYEKAMYYNINSYLQTTSYKTVPVNNSREYENSNNLD